MSLTTGRLAGMVPAFISSHENNVDDLKSHPWPTCWRWHVYLVRFKLDANTSFKQTDSWPSGFPSPAPIDRNGVPWRRWAHARSGFVSSPSTTHLANIYPVAIFSRKAADGRRQTTREYPVIWLIFFLLSCCTLQR